jgi:hypothetical protein
MMADFVRAEVCFPDCSLVAPDVVHQGEKED